MRLDLVSYLLLFLVLQKHILEERRVLPELANQTRYTELTDPVMLSCFNLALFFDEDSVGDVNLFCECKPSSSTSLPEHRRSVTSKCILQLGLVNVRLHLVVPSLLLKFKCLNNDVTVYIKARVECT